MDRLTKSKTRGLRGNPKSLLHRYVVALAILMTLYFGGHFFSMSATNSVNSDASIGLLISRQEALSQRISVKSFRLTIEEDVASIRNRLDALIDEFSAAHVEILAGAGDPAMKPENSERLRPIFFQDDSSGLSLDDKVREFVSEARKIQSADRDNGVFILERLNAMQQLGLYKDLERATEAFQLDSEGRGHHLHMIQVVILFAGILVIFLEACLIFWPAHVATRNAMGALEEKSKELQIANESLQDSLLDAELARGEADRSNGAKSMFLANMSHELRTPLNAIIGFSTMIKAEVFGSIGNKRYKEYVNDIERSGQHLLDLIGDLMDLSQVEVGAAQLEPKNVVITELMADVESLITGWPMARSRNISFIAGEDRDSYFGDPRRLRQIILNLLSNAIKFTDDNARITVVVLKKRDGGLKMIVEDAGQGFELVQIEMLTQPFQRGDDALTRSREGSGLGLPLVLSFAKMHGGSVAFENVETGGARVIVSLPPAEEVEGSVPIAA